MAIEPYQEMWPQVDSSAFVASSADLIGQVEIGTNASIWYNTTLRADINKIIIGEGSNIQDNSCIHLADDFGCYVGKYVTVGHGAILHACTIEDNVLIGMGAIVLDGAVIGAGSIIGAHTLVTKGSIIPPHSLVLGSPGKVVKDLGPDAEDKNHAWAEKYIRVSRNYLSRNLDPGFGA
ncbi:MAG: gamma carbonic anhydrase family protein [Akkermansia sp.]